MKLKTKIVLTIILSIVSITMGTILGILTTEKEHFAKEYTYTMEVKMIRQEIYTDKNGQQLVKTYSDQNKYIVKVGSPQIDSVFIDVYPCKYTYCETDKFVENEEKEIEDEHVE